MRKGLRIAAREFEATVATKGFIVGLLITPLILAFMIVVMPRLMTREAPRISGDVAVIDPTGEVTAGVAARLRPEALAERRDQQRRRLREASAQATQALGRGDAQARVDQQIDQVLGSVPRLEVQALPASADLEQEKAALVGGPTDPRQHQGRLALVVVHANAVRRASQAEPFGAFDLYVRDKLDDRIEDEIRNGLREAIVDARVRHSGLDRAQVEALTRVAAVTSRTVTAAGERETNEVANVLLPAGFMVLLLVSVLTSGQYLLTSTVEEKSNRVVEVLLSAVSPMELMTGKILGQMAVGLLVLALYAGLGVSALFSFAMTGALDVSLILYLVVFFLLSYLTIGSLMAAIGSAVNEMREAQTMMTPVMLLVMVPWLLWMPISRDPNSLFATVLSFVPPLGNFVMLLRMTSTVPPPTWQVWLAILVSAAGAYAAGWFAAKVFRIGLLMFGKPPSFATLVKWARMA